MGALHTLRGQYAALPPVFKPWPAQPNMPKRTISIPENLRNKEFVQAFQDYIEHRKQGWPKEPWTMVAAQRKLATLSKLGLDEALRWMNFTLDEGLKNIQEPFVRGFGKDGADDALSRGYRDAKRELGL